MVGGFQTPVSGLHNGTASLANPTLSPTSELHELKGTGDTNYCTKQDSSSPVGMTAANTLLENSSLFRLVVCLETSSPNLEAVM